jgi:putative membrane fusion protein
MKQGKSYFTVILWILLAAIAAYFGYNVVSSLYAPLMTATVTPYEAGAGYYASGFVVREEELLYSQYGTTVLNCAEGAHVAANDAVATGYRSEDAKTRQTRIDELSGQIEQLQYAWSAVSSVYDQAALDADIAGDLAQLSRYLALRDMNSVSDLSPELKGLILRRTGSDSDSGSLQARISTLQAELETLEAQSAGDTSAILAGKAGTFSAAVDGYESVLTPERLMEMTVAEFESVQPDETDANAIGRLVTSATWYYACVVPASELSGVEEGDRATLTFARDYYQPVTMRVARLGGNEAGSRLLVLSSDRALQNVTLLRQQSAEIVFTSYSGLRVPKSAVRVENGQTGVYILEGTLAKWKPITILHDTGESYVVTLDTSSTNNLWPGDELIINAKNLYDGKVVN